ncbi:MAG TPA: hypothetical protein VEH76_08350 [Methylocystis sp.]|nr:hypothetical protein [Methylocystis sp.]
MRFARKFVALSALGLTLSGCASSELGYDPYTGTQALPTRYGHADFKIDCSRGPASCLERAEAVCHGAYRIIGQPTVSPRVQAYVHWNMVTLNTDNSNIIYVACGA